MTTLLLHSIARHPLNPRITLGDLTHLEGSIREHGIIEPLVVVTGSRGSSTGTCRDCGQRVTRATTRVLLEHAANGIPCPGGSEPAGDDWLLIAGHRRWQAAVNVGHWLAPCVVRDDLRGDIDALCAMVSENAHREPLTPVEEARAFEQLRLFGLSAMQIAERTSHGRKMVSRRLALMRLPDAARSKLQSGVMTLADAEALLDLPPEGVERALRSMGTGRFREDVTRERLRADGSPDDSAAVAERLRSDFAGPYLRGSTRITKRAHESVLRGVVGVLAGSLPRRAMITRWVDLMGVDDPANLRDLDPVRALMGLAVACGRALPEVYTLLGELGYESSPVELGMLGETVASDAS